MRRLLFTLTMFSICLVQGQDWNGIPVPADAGNGKNGNYRLMFLTTSIM